MLWRFLQAFWTWQGFNVNKFVQLSDGNRTINTLFECVGLNYQVLNILSACSTTKPINITLQEPYWFAQPVVYGKQFLRTWKNIQLLALLHRLLNTGLDESFETILSKYIKFSLSPKVQFHIQLRGRCTGWKWKECINN